MARVLLENVSKVFDKQVTAVSDFTLEVADSQFMVIVGPSGSGKTTILRMIAGLEKPTSGNIYIGDALVNDIPPRNRDIAMVFQNYSLYPHMNVYENIAFALKMRKLRKSQINEQVKKVSELLAIDQLLTRKPQALSGGQRQRVAVGRAIVRNPKVFLFDEPLSNLDVGLRAATRSELKALHQKLNITSMYVTHDQTEAMTLGDRICVVYNGIIQQIGVPIEVYERPANKFVAGFFGTPSMNFLDGTIRCIDDNTCFVTGQNCFILPARLKPLLTQCMGKQMVLGIRPENLSVEGSTTETNNYIQCAVTAIQCLGNRTDLHLKACSNHTLVASIDPHTDITVNQKIPIHIDTGKIHIFESSDTGKNIAYQ